jgi:ribosome-associated toxin RatA of RatAB toxin-antitoxin module
LTSRQPGYNREADDVGFSRGSTARTTVTTERRKPLSLRHCISNATPREVYDVLVDFRAYPEMFPDLRDTRVLDQTGSVLRVEFRARVVVPVRFVLDVICKPDVPSVDWTFVEGTVVEGSAGSWRLSGEDGGTVVDYTASLDVRAPLPRFVLRKVTDGLVIVAVPKMFASIEREVRRRQSRV